jgi:hypothetical protein
VKRQEFADILTKKKAEHNFIWREIGNLSLFFVQILVGTGDERSQNSMKKKEAASGLPFMSRPD